jgi:putative ABC transport system ATP-binding protein
MSGNGTSSGAAALRVVDAVKVYGEGEGAVRALDGVTVDIAAGRFTAIMGPSGSGKSTLLHCLAGLDTLTEGRVELDGVDLGSLPDKELTLLRRSRFGFVFQSFNLIPTLTLRENIELPLQLAGTAVDAAWMDEVVGMLGLGDRLSHRPSELSGGQQQRAAVARAMVTRPAVVFGDEPTGNLDSTSGGELLGFLRSAVDDHGQTIVMVTHDPFAAACADRVLFLVDGRIVDTLEAPTREAILERMGGLASAPATTVAAPAATAP